MLLPRQTEDGSIVLDGDSNSVQKRRKCGVRVRRNAVNAVDEETINTVESADGVIDIKTEVRKIP